MNAPAASRPLRLFDAHVHLDFMREPARVADEAEALGLALAAVTVTPDGYERLRAEVGSRPNVVCGLGLHPWWVARATAAELEGHLEAFRRLLPRARLVGEVGLDLSPRHADPASFGAQREAFRRVAALAAAASDPGRPTAVSVHAVGAATEVLDVLEETGCAERCRCVLHWYSGPSDELWRAMRMGCLVSLGERSLATRRGREYARILPEDRLLTETDQPPGEDVAWDAGRIAASLEATLEGLGEVRGEGCRELVAANARAWLGL